MDLYNRCQRRRSFPDLPMLLRQASYRYFGLAFLFHTVGRVGNHKYYLIPYLLLSSGIGGSSYIFSLAPHRSKMQSSPPRYSSPPRCTEDGDFRILANLYFFPDNGDNLDMVPGG